MKEKLIIGVSGDYSIPINCEEVRHYDITIHSISPCHCGGSWKPALSHIKLHRSRLCFRATIEPGDICEVTVHIKCVDHE